MGWLPVVLGLVSGYLFGRKEHPFLFWLSIISAILAFWSLGIMHNFAFNIARARREQILKNMRSEGIKKEEIETLESYPIKLSVNDTQAAPDWATRINLIVTLICATLFCLALYFRIRT